MRNWAGKGGADGQAVKEVCREHGIASGTYYNWKAKYGGMDVNEARCLRELEQENRRLKTALAEVTLREGWQINRKRVAQANRLPRVLPIAPNLQWSLDFMRDTLASGRVLRTLKVVDDATRVRV